MTANYWQLFFFCHRCIWCNLRFYFQYLFICRLETVSNQGKGSGYGEAPAKFTLVPRTACGWNELVFQNGCRIGETRIEHMSSCFYLKANSQGMIKMKSLLFQKVVCAFRVSERDEIVGNQSHASAKFYPGSKSKRQKIVDVHVGDIIASNIAW